MALIRCYRCGGGLSAMDKRCPACGTKVSVWGDIRYQVEHSRAALAGVTAAAVLLLGVAWYLRMDMGMKWPIYAALILEAPLVPWLLKLIYQAAAPTGVIPEDKDND